jgi:formylglycine-generating enzyme required for sulfatase activity
MFAYHFFDFSRLAKQASLAVYLLRNILAYSLAFLLLACDSADKSSAISTSPHVAEVVFDTVPVDATIFMPGLQRPLSKTNTLPKGRFLIEISAEGYESERLWLDIDSEQPQLIQLALTPKSEPVALKVWPPGTDMQWRSASGEQGVTHAIGQPRLVLGSYTLTFTKPGYYPQSLSLDVQEGGVYTLDISLTPIPKKVGEVFRDSLVNGQQGPAMVVIPEGEFEQGDTVGEGDWREQPIRKVRLPSFAMGVTEVTREAYEAFTTATQRPMPMEQQHDGQRPITGVSYEDAIAYAQWLSQLTGERYRLPSESEWEYAARAGSRDNYAFGNYIACDMAHYDGLVGCGHDEPAPVASYKANAFGLFDMHGNVWEWTADCATEDYSDAPTDGSAFQTDPCYRAMLRGGSYILNAHKLRVSYRSWRYRDYRHTDTGFRLVRELK